MGNTKKNKIGGWSNLPGKAEEILGSDFWEEISGIMPKRGPAIDVYRAGDEIVVVVEAPGIKVPENINVALDSGRLKIYGDIPCTYNVSQEDLLQRERFYGSFSREIMLPFTSVSEREIKALYKNGLLEIRVPLLIEQKGYNVDIKYMED